MYHYSPPLSEEINPNIWKNKKIQNAIVKMDTIFTVATNDASTLITV